MSAVFRPLERQTMLAPLGVRFRDAVTGAHVAEGLRVAVYPTENPLSRAPALPNPSGTYVVHRAAGLHEITRGAGDENFWKNLPPGKSYTVEVTDGLGRYLPQTFRLALPVRGLFTWIWPLYDSTAAPQPAEAGKNFRDDFNDNAQNTASWRRDSLTTPISSWDDTVQLFERNGRLEITPKTSTTGRRYNGYVSAVSWNMTNARASVEVVQATTNNAETVFTIAADVNNWFRFIVRAGRLIFQHRLSGADDTVVVDTPYVAAQHRFWRFRHDRPRDEVVFETSADGASWTRRRGVRRQFSITAMTVEISAGTSVSVAAPGTAFFDNFLMETNPVPSVPLFASPTRDALAGTAVVRTTLWNPLTNRPASFAVFEARVPGGQTVRTVADREGRAALHFPYPEPIVPLDPQTKPIPLVNQEWALDVRAYYRPPDPLPQLPDLLTTLAQPRAALWSDEARTVPLARVPTTAGQPALRYGQTLVLRSQRVNPNAPLEPTPLAVLLITPPA